MIETGLEYGTEKKLKVYLFVSEVQCEAHLSLCTYLTGISILVTLK